MRIGWIERFTRRASAVRIDRAIDVVCRQARMRLDRIGGLMGRRIDDEWQRSIEVLAENTSGCAVGNVVVHISSDGWHRAVPIGEMDAGKVLPMLVAVPPEAKPAILEITAEYTDSDGQQISVEAGWKPEPRSVDHSSDSPPHLA